MSKYPIQKKMYGGFPEGIERIPLKAIHIKKCPVVVTCKTLERGHSELVKTDVPVCHILKSLRCIGKIILNYQVFKI
ncbi:MAG: hypothetical protein DRI57_19025 [Deltaproteobacteria bacterium]|nr:MAG: hypothetical protein DRI57_19025 [Deltaproteobacteria bacterium]